VTVAWPVHVPGVAALLFASADSWLADPSEAGAAEQYLAFGLV